MSKSRKIAVLSTVWLPAAVLGVFGLLAGATGEHDRETPVQVAGAAVSSPPAPTITSGPSGTVPSTLAGFTYSDTQNGVQFQCKLDSAAFTTCGKNGVTYAGLDAGGHTFSVAAQQGNGPLSLPDTRSWSVVVPPPAPVITSGPLSSTIEPDATFTFTGSQVGASFECKLDSAAFAACSSPKSYESLAIGSHTFTVRALSAAATSATATHTWTVANASFGIAGSLTAALAPGLTQPLNLVLTNPYNSSHGLDVTGVTINVKHGTTRAGSPNPDCDGPTNVAVTAGSPAPWPVNIPRTSTRSLSELGIPPMQWPQVTMLNLPENQDACKGTTFHFTYTGTATK